MTALEAIVDFAKVQEINLNTYVLRVKTNTSQQYTNTFRINKSNHMILDEKKLPNDLHKFEIEATGHGCAMVQFVEKFNIKMVGRTV